MGLTEICPLCNSYSRLMADHPDGVLYRCTHCKHCYSLPKTNIGFEQYNDEYYEKKHEKWFNNPNIKLFTKISNAILKDNNCKSIIDIGCGRGDFLKFLSLNNAGLYLVGIDTSLNQSSQEIKFLNGDALTTHIDGTFDAVVSLAVIEHIDDVKSFCGRLIELCNPGGTIAIMTVNESSFLYGTAKFLSFFRINTAFNRLYSAHHLHHFTQKSLNNLMLQFNVQLVEQYTINGKLSGTDIPTKSKIMDSILRFFLIIIMIIGRFSKSMYLQVAVYKKNYP